MTFASAPGCTQNGGVVTCTVASLASGLSTQRTVVVTVNAGTTGSLLNSASVGSATSDPVAGNNSASSGMTVLSLADVEVSKTVDNSTPPAGGTVVFTVTVTNNGPQTATGVVISDTLPAGLTYQTSAASQGVYTSSTGIWGVGNVLTTTPATLLLTTTVNAGTAGTTITNTAAISAVDQIDPIPANDSAGVGVDVLPALSIADVSVTEGNAGSDYITAAGTLTFAPGITQQPLTITVSGDTTTEGNESFFVNLNSPANVTITDGQATGIIVDDDGSTGVCGSPVLTLTATADTYLKNNQPNKNFGQDSTLKTKPLQGNSRTALLQFDLSAIPPGANITCAALLIDQLSLPDLFQVVTIHRVTTPWVEGNGSAIDTTGATWNQPDKSQAGAWGTPGGDYDSKIEGWLWPLLINHRVGVTGLAQYWAANPAGNYGMLLKASSLGSNGTIDYASREDGVNPVPRLVVEYTPGLSINDAGIIEGNSGTTSAVFTVTLSSTVGQTVTVDYATTDNTATTADNDYVAASGVLTFAPGVTTQTLSVPVHGDVQHEPDETFLVNLSNPTNAGITDGQGVGTIFNDELGGMAVPAGGNRIFLPLVMKAGASLPGDASSPAPSAPPLTASAVKPEPNRLYLPVILRRK